MLFFVVLSGVLAVCSCQAYLEDSTTQKPWPGPFADNKLGELVQDTPEVARAKEEHSRFFKEALAILPALPPEERYIPGPYETSQQVAQQQIQEGQRQAQQPSLLQLQQQPYNEFHAPQTQYQAPQQSYQQHYQQQEPYQQPQQQYQQKYQQPDPYQQPQQQYQQLNLRFQEPEPEPEYQTQNSKIPQYTGYQVPAQQDGYYQQPPQQNQYVDQYQPAPKYHLKEFKELAELNRTPYYQSNNKQNQYDSAFPEKYFALPQQEERGYYVPEGSAPSARYVTAKDIPRSPFGETPEVALAREEHLKAVAEAKARNLI